MKTKIFYLLLLIIILIGSYLRVVDLDKVPPHLGNDEISIAFDSYSVRLLGKDEHGHNWPLSFESHRSYKAPLYAYLNMPLNWLFGNTEYGIRLLSAFFGIFIIILVAYFGLFFNNNNLAIIAAILFALNPKAIFVSRIGYESNVAFVIMTLGVLFMFYFRKFQKISFLVLAGIFLGISIWGYHTQWGLVPLLACILPFLSKKEVPLRKWIPMWLIILFIAVPVFYDFVSVQTKDVNNRANSQLWFSAGQTQDYIKSVNDKQIKKITTLITMPIYNYMQHFDFDSLFTSGADMFNGESPLEHGWFLFGCIPLLIYGLIDIKKVFGKYWSWVLAWWLLCPIVPALTEGGVASVRNLSFLAPSILIMSGGFYTLLLYKKLLAKLIFILLIVNVFIFLMAYFIHFKFDSSDNFQYGYKEAWEFIQPLVDNYDQIIVEPKFGIYGQYTGVPHLYFGYFKAFDPELMQSRTDIDGTKIDKYYFRGVDWNDEELKPKSIYIVSIINPMAGKAYDKLKLLNTIEKVNHEPQFLIYETIDK